MESEQVDYKDAEPVSPLVIPPQAAPAPVVFTIHWSQIDNIINFLSNRQTVLFDYPNQVYMVDGVPFTPVFLNEVVSKASHLINVISNVQLENKAHIKPKLQVKE